MATAMTTTTTTTTTHTIAGGKYDRRDTAAIQKDPWVEWAEGLPTNERVEEGLQWLAGELRAAEKAAHVDEVGRRLLVDAQRAVEQLARLQREKNPEAHLQTALREALLLRHDLREQAAHAPFRLSPDPHLTRLHDLSRAATLLARDLGTPRARLPTGWRLAVGVGVGGGCREH
jgi:hypothetical protein